MRKSRASSSRECIDLLQTVIYSDKSIESVYTVGPD